MISQTMQDAINEQINKELYSSYLYLSMAAYFANKNLAGFSKWMQTGNGVISFRNEEEAIEGINAINKDYKAHCKAARNIAEEYFNSSIVLSNLIKTSFSDSS